MTPQMLIDTLKKYPNDIFVISNINSNFCTPLFIEQLTDFINDETPCANILTGYEGIVPQPKETNVSSEVKFLLERIKKECE